MGFLRGLIDFEDDMYVVSLFYSWMYVGEQIVVKKFDNLTDAKEWVLQERTYDSLVISDAAQTALSYKDALKLQLKGKKFHKKHK